MRGKLGLRAPASPSEDFVASPDLTCFGCHNSTLVDPKGRTVKVWNADNSPGTIDPKSGGSTAASIEFKLDGFGRMRSTKLKDQTPQITATYDAYGRQLSLNDPDKGNWTYLNNVLGQVVSQTDARGNITNSTFDRLGRPLTRVTFEPSSGPVESAKWFYYDNVNDTGFQLVAKGEKGWIGALERDEVSTINAPGYAASNSLARNIHYYNAKGLPEIVLSQIDGKFFSTRTVYDPVYPWRVTGVKHHWKPAGAEQPDQQPYVWQDFGYSYTYDGSGSSSKSYLVTLSDSLGRPWWSNPSYDHMDRVTSVRKGDGHTTTRTYRPTDGVLTAINTGGGAIQNMTFKFDGLGNLVQRAEGALIENFGYDNLNRLTHRGLPALAPYATYAPNGNILTKVNVSGTTSGTYTYDANKPHAVATAWGYTMGYDQNGNVSSRTKTGESWNFKYAGFDKPRWMAKTTGSATVGSEFLYNANRSRTVQLEFDSMTAGAPLHYVRKRVYAMGPTLELNYENTVPSDSGQSWTLDTVRIYVPGPDGIVGAREFRPASGGSEKALVYHYDHLGSIAAITDYGSTATTYSTDSGSKPGRFSEDAWGQRRNPFTWTGPPETTGANKSDDGGADSLTPRGFTGHEMLDDLGLVHMNGRIYDPLLGRFLSADVVVQAPGNLQAYNRFSYVGNNPLSLTDPSGYFAAALALPSAAEFAKAVAVAIALYAVNEYVVPPLFDAINSAMASGAQATQAAGQASTSATPLTESLNQTDVGSRSPETVDQAPPTSFAPPTATAPGSSPSPTIKTRDDQSTSAQPEPSAKPISPYVAPEARQREQDDATIYRTMNRDSHGNWIPSPSEGAPNANQLGARTAASNPLHPDFPNVTSPTDIVAGVENAFSLERIRGLSASPTPTPVGGGTTVGSVQVSMLPPGLVAIRDRTNHVTIAPAAPMEFQAYQTLLNSIPWQDTGVRNSR